MCISFIACYFCYLCQVISVCGGRGNICYLMFTILPLLNYFMAPGLEAVRNRVSTPFILLSTSLVLIHKWVWMKRKGIWLQYKYQPIGWAKKTKVWKSIPQVSYVVLYYTRIIGTFLLSQPQLNLNSTQKLGLTWKWL